MLQVKNFIGLVDGFNNVFGTFMVGVAQKYLPEILLVHQADDMCDTLIIQFIKNIIEQKNWRGFYLLPQYMELRKLKGDKKGFLLTLASEFLDGVPCNLKFQIVFVDSPGSILQSPVLIQALFEEIA
jgi:hypothetical protein